ncbi:hypothetical protein FQZ97_1196920 [compost metagenome]
MNPRAFQPGALKNSSTGIAAITVGAMNLAAMASAPAGQSQPPQPAVSRTTISITAMPCNTPK